MKPFLFIMVGFVLGVAAMFCILGILSRTPPPPPFAPEADSITVYLHPWHGYEAATCQPVRIPVEQHGEILRRLAPETYYGDIHERITPLVADVVITRAGQARTHVLVREGGHNPAVVSIDGVNYFYAKNEPDVYAGANELINLVAGIAYKQQEKSSSD